MGNFVGIHMQWRWLLTKLEYNLNESPLNWCMVLTFGLDASNIFSTRVRSFLDFVRMKSLSSRLYAIGSLCSQRCRKGTIQRRMFFANISSEDWIRQHNQYFKHYMLFIRESIVPFQMAAWFLKNYSFTNAYLLNRTSKYERETQTQRTLLREGGKKEERKNMREEEQGRQRHTNW